SKCQEPAAGSACAETEEILTVFGANHEAAAGGRRRVGVAESYVSYLRKKIDTSEPPPAADPARRRLLPSAAAYMRGWPLRVKLVALTLVLLAAALVISGAVGVYSTREYQLQRVDDQLRDSVPQSFDDCERALGDHSPNTTADPYGAAPAQ